MHFSISQFALVLCSLPDSISLGNYANSGDGIDLEKFRIFLQVLRFIGVVKVTFALRIGEIKFPPPLNVEVLDSCT